MDTDVIKNLRRFNRKERYWLLCEACNEPFTLSDGFRKELQRVLGVSIPEDKNVFVAMDYHFDWIKMAISDVENQERIPITKWLEDVNGNQEDVDLLVAFKGDDKKTHLIMIEAKVDTNWTSKQLKSKMERLEMFDDDAFVDCEPHLVFMSPESKEPRLDKLIDDDKLVPNWIKKKYKNEEGKRIWIKMSLKGSPAPGFLQVTRKKEGGDKYTQLVVLQRRLA